MVNPKKSIPESSKKDRINAIRKEKLKELKDKEIGDINELPVILSKLNEKERVYVEARLAQVKKKEAGKIADPGTARPADLATRMENNPLVVKALALSLDAIDLGPAALAIALQESLFAKKAYYSKKHGRLMLSWIPDHKQRLETVKVIAELMGLKVKDSDPGGDKHYHLHLNKDELDQMEEGVLAHLQNKFGKKS